MRQSASENQVCDAWLKWMSLNYPAVYKHVIKLENEGLTNRGKAVRLGLHVGASDYFIAWPTLEYYGAMIEVKRDGWKLTKSNAEHHGRQMEFGSKMQKKGYAFYFCIGLDELIAATNDYLQM